MNIRRRGTSIVGDNGFRPISHLDVIVDKVSREKLFVCWDGCLYYAHPEGETSPTKVSKDNLPEIYRFLREGLYVTEPLLD